MGTTDLLFLFVGGLFVSFGIWHIIFKDHARATYLELAARAKNPRQKHWLATRAQRLGLEGFWWIASGLATILVTILG